MVGTHKWELKDPHSGAVYEAGEVLHIRQRGQGCSWYGSGHTNVCLGMGTCSPGLFQQLVWWVKADYW